VDWRKLTECFATADNIKKAKTFCRASKYTPELKFNSDKEIDRLVLTAPLPKFDTFKYHPKYKSPGFLPPGVNISTSAPASVQTYMHKTSRLGAIAGIREGISGRCCELWTPYLPNPPYRTYPRARKVLWMEWGIDNQKPRREHRLRSYRITAVYGAKNKSCHRYRFLLYGYRTLTVCPIRALLSYLC